MGSWVFLTGASGGGGLNQYRRFAVYDTVADSSFYTNALPANYLPQSNVSMGVISPYLFVTPGGDRVNPLNVQPYYTLNGVELTNLDEITKQIYSYYTHHDTFRLVYLGSTLFWLFTEQDVLGDYYVRVYKVNANGTATLYYSIPMDAGSQHAIAANSKIYVFYAGDGNRIRYYTSSNGVSWTDNLTTDSVVLATYASGYDVIADISATYGFAMASSPLADHGAFTVDGGVNWTAASGIPADIDFIVADANGVFVTAAGHIYKSTNGTSWTDMGQPLSGEAIYGIEYGNSEYIIFGEYGYAATTTDFTSFSTFTDVDFEFQHIFAAIYTTETVQAEPDIIATISATTNSDIVSIQSTVNSAEGSIQGTLKLDNASGSFAARPVILYTYPGGIKVDETTSDGTTGAWEFTQVSPGDYFVVGLPSAEDSEIYNRDFDADGIITVA